MAAKLTYWVFHSEMLMRALAQHEQDRVAAGASEQQAKDETLVIVQFLASPAAWNAKLVGDRP